jgi:RES domain-containing protein
MDVDTDLRTDGPGRTTGPAPFTRLADQLRDCVEPWGGPVYCHAPADQPFNLAVLGRPDDGHERWGTSGLRTVFLATDPAIAIAEYARHRSPGAPADERRVVAMRLSAITVVDLRRPAVADALGVSTPSRHVGDRHVARRVAADVRRTGLCQGLIVPSMAFLDRPERSNVVLFVEHLGRDLDQLLGEIHEVGRLRLIG